MPRTVRSRSRGLQDKLSRALHRLAAGLLQRLGADGARAQQHRHAARAVHDGGFDAQAAGAAVQNQQIITQLALHMGGRGGADAAKAVGAGRGHAPDCAVRTLAQGAQQRLRAGVRGAAQAD